jgi:hypothetical protein
MCRPIPRELVHTPAWWSLHRVHVLRHDQYGQYFAYSLNQVTPYTPVIVVLNETPQTSVSYTTDIHMYYRTSIPYSGQVFFEIEQMPISPDWPCQSRQEELGPLGASGESSREGCGLGTHLAFEGSPCEACRTGGQERAHPLQRKRDTLSVSSGPSCHRDPTGCSKDRSCVSPLTDVLPPPHGQRCYICYVLS